MDTTRRGVCRRWAGTMGTACVAVVAAAMVAGCAAKPARYAAQADDCMAACNRPSADGQACLQWSAFVGEACVARYSVAASCCGSPDRAMCALTTPLAAGSPCVCRGADAKGAYVVQGYACAAH